MAALYCTGPQLRLRSILTRIRATEATSGRIAVMSQRPRYRRHATTLLAGVLLLSAIAVARADVFQLASGGRVQGEWLNRDEQPLSRYLVKTTGGVVVELPITQVRETVRQSPAEADYEKRAVVTADTVSAQWELAEWCRQHRLAAQRQRHLERIIALDPNHQQARSVLGYQFLQGKWMLRDEFRRQEGYEFYRGRWRTPQEIEVLEARARNELAQKEWMVRLKRWRQELGGERPQLALEQLTAIKDPVAAGPLGDFFRREGDRRVKMLYADILANINTSEAQGVLIERTLADVDEEVFHYCLDKIVELQPPRAADPFIAALKDEYNARINRAAMALARLGDRSAISPLIDALITTHTHVLPGRPGAGPDSTTTTFGGSSTVMKQNEGPKVIVAHVQNQHVLDALTKLSGSNFGFDQRAWRYWHAQEKHAAEAAQPLVSARRE